MTLPLEPASVTGLPSRPVSLKSGAGSGLRTKRMLGCCSWATEKEGRKQRSSEVTTKRTKQGRSEEHTSELQSHLNLVCRLLLEKKKKKKKYIIKKSGHKLRENK